MPTDPTPGANDLRVGQIIRSARGKMSQEKLAARLGIDRSFVGFIERGERRPSITLLWSIADELGIPADQLAYDGMLTEDELQALEVLRRIPAKHRASAIRALRAVAEIAAGDPPVDK